MKHLTTVTVQRPALAMMGLWGLGGMKGGSGGMWQWMNEDMWSWMQDYMGSYKTPAGQ